MIIVFDLDDTLYSEITFVYSGFACIAQKLTEIIDVPESEIFTRAKLILEKDGRDKVFDALTKHFGIYSDKLVKSLVSTYRSHEPAISLKEDVKNLLLDLKRDYSLYIVTDGNKLVQKSKVVALDLEPYFRRILITHQFGLFAAKPSLICFDKIRSSEDAQWSSIVYVGDDPHKDFVSLNKVGAVTIRVLDGRFRGVELESPFEARYRINSLNELPELLLKLS